jgi:DNA-binding transcriptional MerR regulator
MPFQVNGQTMYKTKEACKLAGTNVDTFFRWVREGKFADVEYRDRNGWRLFTDTDIRRLEARVNRIYRTSGRAQTNLNEHKEKADEVMAIEGIR